MIHHEPIVDVSTTNLCMSSPFCDAILLVLVAIPLTYFLFFGAGGGARAGLAPVFTLN